MRVVLDTGILIATLIVKGTPPDQIYRAWIKRRFDLITSNWQLDEFRRVSRYPRIRKYLAPSRAGLLVNGLRQRAVVLQDLPEMDESTDPDDNPVLAMAVAGKADYLVTGDKRDLLVLGSVGSTTICTARDFVRRL